MVSANASPPEQEPEVEASKRIVDGSKATSETSGPAKHKLRTYITANRQRLPFIIFVLVVAVIGTRLLWPTHAEETSNSTEESTSNLSTNIDYTSQSAVNKAYWDLWVPAQTTDPGWTGSITNCDPGNMSSTARSAELDAINFARRLQQLAPVSAASSTVNAKVMKTALLMDANNKVSHYPTADQFPICWTQVGNVAANIAVLSDISQGSNTVGNHIANFMDDTGEPIVGHRAWLSLPEAKVFGIGTTTYTGIVQVANLPTSYLNPRPDVMWPMKGYFPSTMAPGRTFTSQHGTWSYISDKPHTSIAMATVSVTHDGQAVAGVSNLRRDSEYWATTIYKTKLLTWDMPLRYPNSGDYTVTIKNIKNTFTGALFSRSYTVHFFDPVKP